MYYRARYRDTVCRENRGIKWIQGYIKYRGYRRIQQWIQGFSKYREYRAGYSGYRNKVNVENTEGYSGYRDTVNIENTELDTVDTEIR